MKFTYLILGEGLAKSENGGFSGKGDWTLFKCFVENKTRYGDNGYGEFFLNLNMKTGEGCLAMKDKNYSVFLEEEFSREMSGLNYGS